MKDAVCRSPPRGTARPVIRGTLSSLSCCLRAWLWGTCEGESRRMCRVPGMAPTWPARACTVACLPPRHPGRVPHAEVTSWLSGSSPFESNLRWPVGTCLGGSRPGWARFLWEVAPHTAEPAAAAARAGRALRSPAGGLRSRGRSPLSSCAAQPRGSRPCPVLFCRFVCFHPSFF